MAVSPKSPRSEGEDFIPKANYAYSFVRDVASDRGRLVRFIDTSVNRMDDRVLEIVFSRRLHFTDAHLYLSKYFCIFRFPKEEIEIATTASSLLERSRPTISSTS